MQEGGERKRDQELYRRRLMSYCLPFVHRCRINECDLDGKSALYAENWIPNAIPYDDGQPEKCLRYSINATSAKLQLVSNSDECPANLFDRTKVVKCDDFVFKTDEHRVIRQVCTFLNSTNQLNR